MKGKDGNRSALGVRLRALDEEVKVARTYTTDSYSLELANLSTYTNRALVQASAIARSCTGIVHATLDTPPPLRWK